MNVNVHTCTHTHKQIYAYTYIHRCIVYSCILISCSFPVRTEPGHATIIRSSPDILLLDEPTNHLDAQSVAWLERFLAEFKALNIRADLRFSGLFSHNWRVTSQTDTIESLEDLIDYASPTFGRALSKSFGQSLVRQGTVVAITHDRYFLDNVAGWSLGC